MWGELGRIERKEKGGQKEQLSLQEGKKSKKEEGNSHSRN